MPDPVEVGEALQDRLLRPEQLDRLHRAKRLTDEAGHVVGGRPHGPAPLADLGTDRLGEDTGENQRYQQQPGEPQVDRTHDDHRPDSEVDQASHVDPVLEILEKVLDIITEGADGLTRRKRHDPGPRRLQQPPQQISL